MATREELKSYIGEVINSVVNEDRELSGSDLERLVDTFDDEGTVEDMAETIDVQNAQDADTKETPA